MKSEKDILMDAWEKYMGERASPIESAALAKLRRTEWCNTFERLMRNRMLVGYFRYGALHDTTKKNDYVAGARKHLRQYIKTGNTEHLVDVANLMIAEFVQGDHPKSHFRSRNKGIHVQPKTP